MAPWKRTFYATWIGQICSLTGFMAVMPLLPFYVRELSAPGTSDGDVALWSGIVRSGAALTMAISAPIWGALADRHGRKMMVLRSMFGGALVLVLMGFAQSVGDLFLLRLMQGVLTGTITASVALVSSVTPRERSGFTLGMMQAAVFLGAALGPFLGGELAERFGFRVAFLAAAGVVLAGGVLVAFVTREEFTPPIRSNNGRLTSLREIFTAVGFVGALLALFQIRLANAAVGPVFPLFVEDLHGTTEGAKALTGRILGVAGIASALSAGLLFGRLVNAWGHKRVLVLSTLVAGLVTFPLAFVSHVWQLFPLRILFGMAVAMLTPTANIIIHRIIDKQHLGKAYGITASVSCLGWGIGPLAGGWMAAEMGLRAPFILTGAVLLLTSGVVLWRVK